MSTLYVNTINPQSGSTVSVTGTLDVSGTIKSYAFETITTLNTSHSGSNKFGNDTADTHQFTGSLHVSGATNALIVESGKVGIGTTAPGNTLEIEGSSGDLIIEIDNNASNSANFQIQNGAGNARVDLVMNDGSANTTITMKGQKVGIMDTSPSYALDVTGDGQFTTDLRVGDDLLLTSDSAILSLGDGADATLTHDGTTGLTIAANPISIDATNALDLSSTTGDINFQDGGTNQLSLDMDGTAGEVIMQLKVDSDDFVFKQYDGTEVFRVEDNGAFDIAGGLGSSGVTVSAAGALSADGRIVTDDTTEATSTTDGSLQTDGGLSVAKDAIIGDDLKLLSDSAVLSLGLGSDATLTHDGTTGLTIAATPISINSTGDLTLDSTTDIILDADGADISFKDDGTQFLKFSNSSGDCIIVPGATDKDIIVKDTGGSVIFRIDDSEESLAMSADKKITLRDTAIYLHSSTDGQADLVADSTIQVTAPTVNIEASSAVTIESDSITLGEDGNTDVVLAFAGATSDGELKWMEDEDYFEFTDDILVASTEKLQLRDTAIYLYSSADGQADLVADSVIQVTAPTVNIEASTAITLESDSVTFGEAGNTDIVLAFNATTSDGELKWMEDEDYFEFSDDVLVASTEKLQFRDTAIYLYSSADGQLDIVSDGLTKATGPFEIENPSDGGAAALIIDNDDVDQIALLIEAANTTENVVGIAASALTTGAVININHDDSATTNMGANTIKIDYDKSGVIGSGQYCVPDAININMLDSANNHASNAGVVLKALDVTVSSSYPTGATFAVGVDLTCKGSNKVWAGQFKAHGGYSENQAMYLSASAGLGTVKNEGLIVVTDNDAASHDIKILSGLDYGDYFLIQTTTHGATTFTTVDDDAAAADLTFTLDGAFDVNANQEVAIDSTAASITVGAALASGQTLKLGQNGAVEVIIAPHDTPGSELYSVINTAGTTDGSDAAGAILLSSVAGGIGLAWADTKDLWAEGGQFVVTANHDAAGAIKLHADAGTSQTILVQNDAGTTDGTDGAGSILLAADAGGIGLAWADGKDLWAEGGRFVVTANEDAADCIKLHADAGTSQTIQIVNDAGTVDGSDDAGAIELSAAAGGIGLAWADGKDLWAEGGRAIITANEDAADCILLHADAGTSQTIRVLNDAGTNAAAIALTATAGGITMSSGMSTTPQAVVSIEGDSVTTANVLDISADALTTGNAVAIASTNTGNTAATLLKLEAATRSTGTAASRGIYLEYGGNTPIANANSYAMYITSSQSTGDVVNIVADGITTGNGLYMTADALTTGNMIKLESDSASTAMRQLLKIHQDHASATDAMPLYIVQDARQTGNQGVACATFQTTVANQDASTLLLWNSNADEYGPVLEFSNTDSAESNGGDNDYLGQIKFVGFDDGDPSEVTYAKIDAQIGDMTNTTKNGTMYFSAMIANTNTEVARVNPMAVTADTYMGGFGFKRPAGLHTNGQTLTAAESGAVITVLANGATITLPAAAAATKGVIYTFLWIGTAGQTFNISPNASDKIYGSIIDVANGNVVTAASSGAGADNKDLQLDSGSQVGDRVTIMCDGTAGWAILEGLGSWVFES